MGLAALLLLQILDQDLQPGPGSHTMMPAPGEQSETAKLMEMVQKDADSSRPASPRAIQSALAV